nr:MAG TPA: hypothetical protein [Caudoviricetes sp.]
MRSSLASSGSFRLERLVTDGKQWRGWAVRVS